SDLTGSTADRLGDGLQCCLGGSAVHRRCLDGDHQRIAVAAADLGTRRAGPDPDGDPDGGPRLYTRRSTATTMPRMLASSPSIGSYASLCGISQTWPSLRLKVLTVASLSSRAATMSPFSAVCSLRTTTQSPSQMAASIME